MELAGALRIAEAVPRIVEYLAEADDSLFDSAVRALARIGDPRAATFIEEGFFTKDKYFQLGGMDALGAFKHPECERVILSLRADERTDARTAALLCDSLCRHFHPAALDWARDIWAHEQEEDLNEFEEDLLTLCRLHGIEAPEAVEWHAEIEEREARFAEMLRQLRAGELPPLDSPEDDEEYLDDEDYPDDEDYLDDEEYPGEEDWDDEDNRDEDEGFGHTPYPGPYEPMEPYRRPTPKIGRNEPCPCGSGRKYKKCCGRE
jgi:HEAT repeat protein